MVIRAWGRKMILGEIWVGWKSVFSVPASLLESKIPSLLYDKVNSCMDVVFGLSHVR